MFDEKDAARKQRPATVLAVLFGLLLGFAGTTGTQLRIDPNTARLGHADSFRTSVNLRASPRSDDDASDDDVAPSLALPPTPQIVTQLVSLRPAADAVWASLPAAPSDRHPAYHARAPPAA